MCNDRSQGARWSARMRYSLSRWKYGGDCDRPRPFAGPGLPHPGLVLRTSLSKVRRISTERYEKRSVVEDNERVVECVVPVEPLCRGEQPQPQGRSWQAPLEL